jgi:VCBS repeat-containing protein
MAQTGTVATLKGQVLVITESGQPRLLAVGDVVQAGDTVRPAPGASVELTLDDGQPLHLGADQAYRMGAEAPIATDPAVETTVQTVIDALERGASLDDIEAAAAGLAGGGEGDGSSFVRLLRISEDVSPLAYQYTAPGLPTVETVLMGAEPPATEPPATEPPATEPPATEPPATEPPATEPPATEPPATEPPSDKLPDAVNDDNTASILVERTEGTFLGDTRVMGAGEQSMTDRIAHPQNQQAWLLSDGSFKDQVNGFQGAFTIEDKGAGGDQGDPAFVVTPNFMAESGDQFRFTASTDLNPGDSFTAEVYQNTASGWQLQGTIAGVDSDYTYQFTEPGEYRVSFTVDCNTGGNEKAFATIDVQTDDYFYVGGGENITLTDAVGNILVNDTLGDGTHVWAFEDGAVAEDGTVTVLGDHGTLVVDPDGDYTYTPSDTSTGGVDAFNYTLTDADGDVDQGVLSITVEHDIVTLPDGATPESYSVGEATTVLDSTDLLEAPSPLGGDDLSVGTGGIESAGTMDVLAANLNADTDESVKRILKGQGNNKNS